MITFGGGILSGDVIQLKVEIRRSASAVLITQATTKVFMKDKIDANSIQTTSFSIAEDAFCAILPQPVTCFRNARYNLYMFHSSNILEKKNPF